MQDDNQPPVEPEILPPENNASGNKPDAAPLANVLLAQVSNYTNRPDLFLETIEKHDPGFIKRMNDDAEVFNKKARKQMFSFGKIQAYAGLIVSVIAAFLLLGTIVASVFIKDIGFWQILAIGIFYAITQAGTSGFANIAGQVAKMVGSKGKESSDDATPP